MYTMCWSWTPCPLHRISLHMQCLWERIVIEESQDSDQPIPPTVKKQGGKGKAKDKPQGKLPAPAKPKCHPRANAPGQLWAVIIRTQKLRCGKAFKSKTLISNMQDGFAQIAGALTAHFAGSSGGKCEGITEIGSPLQKRRNCKIECRRQF